MEEAGLNSVTSLSLSSADVSSPTKVPSTSQSLSVAPLLTTATQEQQQDQKTHDNGGAEAMPVGSDASSLLNQMNQLGPSDRCTPSQAQAMGQQLLSIIAYHERNKITLPGVMWCVCVCVSVCVCVCVCVCV